MPSMPLAGAGTTCQFAPTSISGLQAWFKADAGTSSTTDGVAISAWNDQSGNSRHLSQATGANQPLYKAAVQNGFPGILFDGVNDWMQSTTWTVAQPATVVVVSKRVADGYLLDGVTARMAVLNGNAGKRGLYAGGAGVADDGNVTAVAEIWTCQFNGASSKIYVNGTDQGALSQNPGTGSLTDALVGSHQGKAFGFFSGHIFELLIYNSIPSAGDQQMLERVLGSKYGITVT